jgi:DNA replication protein DnaC
MTQLTISPDLKTVLRSLRLSPVLNTLPERLTLARDQKVPHQDFLLLLLSDEVSRRDSQATLRRVQRAKLDPEMHLEAWDPSAKVQFDQALLNELISLRFLEAHTHVTIVGPVGVGKTFLAHALGHIACRRGYSVLALPADRMLKTLRHARLDNSYEAELRKLVAVDLLLVDDFGLDGMDVTESRDAYEIFIERHRAGSMIVTSNRGPDEWLATFADPVRAQSALDRFTSNAYDLVIEGESYRSRLKPKLGSETQDPRSETQNRRLTSATDPGIHPSTPNSEPEIETTTIGETKMNTRGTGQKAGR